jgi:hypothetical protein
MIREFLHFILTFLTIAIVGVACYYAGRDEAPTCVEDIE